MLPLHGRVRTNGDLTVSTFDLTGANGEHFHFENGRFVWTSWSRLYDFPRTIPPFLRSDSVLPVGHISLRATSGVISMVPFLGGGSNLITPDESGSGINPTLIADEVVPPIPETVWFENSRDAFDAFSDQFPADLSLGNFLLELDDMAAIIPKLEKTLSKTIASAFLNYNFNWKPLIKDLGALFNICASVSSRIEYLKKTRGKPVRINFLKRDLNVTAPSPYLKDFGPGGVMFEFAVADFKTEYRASSWLSQNLTHLDDFYGLLRAYMGKTGLNNPLKIVWNAIPFSFVLDWIVPVSSYLNKWKIQGADGEWNLRDTTCSTLTTCRIIITQVDRVSGDRTHLGEVAFRRYERVVGLPVPLLLLPSLQALSEKQLALLLAMST